MRTLEHTCVIRGKHPQPCPDGVKCRCGCTGCQLAELNPDGSQPKPMVQAPLPDPDEPQPGEVVTFLIPTACVQQGHDPLEDVWPMKKAGGATSIVVRFCQRCHILYWEEVPVGAAG